MNTQPESTPADDNGLGLADLAPAELPADFWEHALSVAVDPSTPPPEDIEVPGDADLASDPDLADDGAVSDPAGDDVDLSEFDDEPLAPDDDPLAADDSDAADDDVNDIDSTEPESDILAPPETPIDQPELTEPYPDSADLGTVEQDEGASGLDDPSAF